MKHLHVSMAVTDIDRSRQFYSALFGAAPTLDREGYVQWLLDDPRVNFVIEAANDAPGLSHLGVQVEDAVELEAQFGRVAAAAGPVFDEGETTCCFAHSTKNWTADPDGMRWESFLTHERTGEYGEPAQFGAVDGEDPGQCCTPQTPQGVCRAPKAELAADAPCCG